MALFMLARLLAFVFPFANLNLEISRMMAALLFLTAASHLVNNRFVIY
jgi:hypothetical protein